MLTFNKIILLFKVHIPTKKKTEMIKCFRKINSESQLTSGKKSLSKKSFLYSDSVSTK